MNPIMCRPRIAIGVGKFPVNVPSFWVKIGERPVAAFDIREQATTWRADWNRRNPTVTCDATITTVITAPDPGNLRYGIYVVAKPLSMVRNRHSDESTPIMLFSIKREAERWAKRVFGDYSRVVDYWEAKPPTIKATDEPAPLVNEQAPERFNFRKACWVASKLYNSKTKLNVFSLKAFRDAVTQLLGLSETVDIAIVRAMLEGSPLVVPVGENYRLIPASYINMRRKVVHEGQMIMNDGFSTNGRTTQISAYSQFEAAKALDHLARMVRCTDVAGRPSGNQFDIVLIEHTDRPAKP